MPYIISIVLLLCSNLTFSKTIEFDLHSSQKESLAEIIVYETSLLDAFWTGDDGIECGKPQLADLKIDSLKNDITFTVIPMGKNYGCERRSMHCRVHFLVNLSGEGVLEDQAIDIFDQCL